MARKKPKQTQANNAATRPHALNDWRSVAALVVSVFSLVVALRSSNTAKDSLRISQQSYLSARSSIFTVRGLRMFANQRGPGGADNSPPVVIGNKIDLQQAQGDLAVHFEFEIENAGNTPAILEGLEVSFQNA